MLRWRGRAYPGRVGPEERRREAPPSVGGAVAKFALVGLVALVVLVGLSVLVIGRISRSEATDDAKRITAVVGRSLIQPNLDDALLRGDPAARARLDRVVRSRVRRGGFVRVKVWTADGRIVYSDRPELVGARYRLGADDLDVLRHGGVEAGDQRPHGSREPLRARTQAAPRGLPAPEHAERPARPVRDLSPARRRRRAG